MKEERQIYGEARGLAAGVGHARPPKVVLGAPVFNRAWILRHWWERIAAQTLRPDGFCFVLGKSDDATGDMLYGGGHDYSELKWGPVPHFQHESELVDLPFLRIERSRLPVYTRNERQADPKDSNRARHMAALRNELRAMFLATDADIFVSLDTDLLLDDPGTLQRLVDAVTGHSRLINHATGTDEWAFAALATVLHPVRESHCYNAAVWADGGTTPGTPDRHWRRMDENDYLARRSPVPIDIPMAGYAITRWALAMCRYAYHDQGEDMGFADSLYRHGFRGLWVKDVWATHVWGPHHLDEVLGRAVTA